MPFEILNEVKIAVATLGCKINQYDSALIQQRLSGLQHSFVPFEEEADFYIINACTVTDRADWEARRLVRRAKRTSPEARVLVTGCYAQVNPREVSQLPGVDFVVGLNRLDDLLRFVADPRPAEERKIAVGNAREERTVSVSGAAAMPGHTRAFLKIQEGCNYSCAYCIIPIARGLSRSVPAQEVIRQIRTLSERGFVEVVLTGIHLGGYGHDLAPKADLTSLLEKIVESRCIPRLRLSSLDPREVPDRLLKLIATSDILCPHLHICAQAGDDRILKQMRRNYDTAYYRDLMCRAREALPEAALGSDVIVGFPGETEEEFHGTMQFLHSLPLTYLHVFPYSVRSGTPAAGLAQQVPQRVKKERARKARELGSGMKREFYGRFVGRRVPVLLEGAVEDDSNLHRGYSRNYLPVVVPAEKSRINREVLVAVERLEAERLSGRIVEGRA